MEQPTPTKFIELNTKRVKKIVSYKNEASKAKRMAKMDKLIKMGGANSKIE